MDIRQRITSMSDADAKDLCDLFDCLQAGSESKEHTINAIVEILEDAPGRIIPFGPKVYET